MADAIVSIVLEQLTSFAVQEIKGGVRLVAGAGKAVESLPSTLRPIQAVLRDAEEKQVKEEAVKLWLDELKDAAYDMEDVLDEWRTSILKLKAEEAAENASTTENYSIPKRVRSFFLSTGFSFRQPVFRCRISHEIKDISERLDVVAKKKDMYSLTSRSIEQPQHVTTTSFVDVSEIYGRNEKLTIKELNEESCWSVFKSLAFSDKSDNEYEKLEGIGRKIVGKCKGLPLAAKIMGSLLRFKKSREEWESVLHSEIWKLDKLHIKMWKLNKFEEDLFPTLFLSYNDLPSMVKRCFSYCAIFPKDYDINKDQLIQLWMAQGYLGLEQNKEMEFIGEEYFDILIARSLFQDLKRDYDDSITGCKMHDIVHDFTLFLTKNEKDHHAMLVGEVGPSAFVFNVKKLRSLLVNNSYVPSKFIFKFTHLRALTIQTRKVSKGIKKLIHLRYLNLSGNYFLEELSEEVCELYNLQTLDVSECPYLRKLPEKMEKLINLRHLINNATIKLEYMPKGMEKLTCLRTLEEFVVSESDNTKACSLDCLQHLTNLRSLGITKLGYLRDVGEAQLQNNQNLLSLDLDFRNPNNSWPRIEENDKVIIEALQPPPNLEKLKIHTYGGSTLFPNWMLSLTNLRVLSIAYCASIERLPSLGKLSSLEVLSIERVTKVKSVGNEILGIKSDDTSAIAFPKLKSLQFSYMPQWEEWDYEITKKDEKDITIMPCLRSLHISWCLELKGIPKNLLQSATLEKLQLNGCPNLKQRCEKERDDYWPKISRIPYVEIDGRSLHKEQRSDILLSFSPIINFNFEFSLKHLTMPST